MDKRHIFIISLVLFLTLGWLLYSNFSRKTNQPTVPQPIIQPVLPDLSGYSEEELIKLWANGERCPGRGFSIPTKEEDFVDTGGVDFLINEVEVDFIKDATCEDAEQIAVLLNGRIVGFGPVTNLYGIEIPTRTLEALAAAIQKVKALNNPKIEGAFRAVVLPHGGN